MTGPPDQRERRPTGNRAARDKLNQNATKNIDSVLRSQAPARRDSAALPPWVLEDHLRAIGWLNPRTITILSGALIIDLDAWRRRRGR